MRQASSGLHIAMEQTAFREAMTAYAIRSANYARGLSQLLHVQRVLESAIDSNERSQLAFAAAPTSTAPAAAFLFSVRAGKGRLWQVGNQRRHRGFV
jgi:hypothetical protein